MIAEVENNFFNQPMQRCADWLNIRGLSMDSLCAFILLVVGMLVVATIGWHVLKKVGTVAELGNPGANLKKGFVVLTVVMVAWFLGSIQVIDYLPPMGLLGHIAYYLPFVAMTTGWVVCATMLALKTKYILLTFSTGVICETLVLSRYILQQVYHQVCSTQAQYDTIGCKIRVEDDLWMVCTYVNWCPFTIATIVGIGLITLVAIRRKL